nr:hypothetical protein Ahy_A10g047660 [Ipomoea batatas]
MERFTFSLRKSHNFSSQFSSLSMGIELTDKLVIHLQPCPKRSRSERHEPCLCCIFQSVRKTPHPQCILGQVIQREVLDYPVEISDKASSPPPNAFSIAKATSSLFTWAPVSSSIPNITGNSTPAFTPVLSTFTTNLSFKNCSANNGQVINGKPEAIPSRVEFHPQCDRLPRQTKRTERNWANGPNWFPLLFPQLFDVFWFQLLKAVYQYPISIILCIFHLFVKLLKFLGHRIKDVFELSFGEFNLIRQSRHFKVLGFRLHAFKITPAP